MRLDERSGSSVALIDDMDTCIAAADRLITEQQMAKNSIRALLAIAQKKSHRVMGTEEIK